MGKKNRRAKQKTAGGRAPPSRPPNSDAKVACSNGAALECPCPHCMGTAWKAGRGGSSSSDPRKSEKRDKSRMKQARASFLEKQMFMDDDKKVNLEDFAKNFEGLDPKDAKNVVLYLQQIRPFVSGQGWAATALEEICEIHEPKEEWSKIESMATSILEEIQRIREETGVSKKLCLELNLVLTPVEWKAHYNRAHGRIGLGKLEAAIADLTEAFASHRAWMAYEPYECKYEDEIDVLYGRYEVEILYFRGRCLFMLNDLDKAIVDFRAAHSGVRAMGETWDGKPSMPMEVVKYFLMAMAKQKQTSGQSRPLCSQQERDSIEKDLGLNSYYYENYQCLECKATPSAAKLKQCARCQEVWFCSKECQTISWKKDHHYSCQLPVGIRVCKDSDRRDIMADFQELGGVTFTSSGKTVGQPIALLRDPVTGRLFSALTDEDVLFLPSESSLLCAEVLKANPADNIEGKRFVDFMSMKTMKYSFSTEVKWLKILAGEVFRAFGKNHAKAERKATTLLQIMQKDVNAFTASTQFRPWVATVIQLSTFMHRAWSRYKTDKFKLALEDATAGLGLIGLMIEWTSQLQGPIHYFKHEKVRLLFIRSQCLKRLEHFEAALTGLRGCHMIIKSFGGRWDDASSHLNSAIFALVPSNTISEEQVIAFIQIVMALQKVTDGAPRPHYSEEEQASLEEELGLSPLTFGKDTIVGPKIVNNDNIGDWDKWAYAEHGVFVVTVAGQVRVLVPDGNGGHFESITDETHFVMDAENARKHISDLTKRVESCGLTFRQV